MPGTALEAGDLEQHRPALTGHCYRMLGSAPDAEDAVQETFVRAWQRGDQYDPGRGSLINWLYGIATHVAIDLARSRRRRALPVDLTGPAAVGDPIGAALPATEWVLPIPDHRVLPESSTLAGDPAELAVLRDSVRLAFVAALQRLPARQRAVLILKDVLGWTTAEIAGLLDLSTAAVGSLLQRSRESVGDQAPGRRRVVDHDLLDRYVDAFTRHDIDELIALLHRDVTMAMPPHLWWIRGRQSIAAALAATDYCRESVFVPVAANGTRAFGQYLPGPDGRLRAWAMLCLDSGEQNGTARIEAITSYLRPEPLFDLFGLPLERPSAN